MEEAQAKLVNCNNTRVVAGNVSTVASVNFEDLEFQNRLYYSGYEDGYGKGYDEAVVLFSNHFKNTKPGGGRGHEKF